MTNDKDLKSRDKLNKLPTNEVDISSVESDFLDLLKEQDMVDGELTQSINELEKMQENESLFDVFNEDTFDSKMTVNTATDNSTTENTAQDKNDNNQLKLIVADILHEDFPSVRALEVMAKELSMRSKGRITMKVFSDGAFGTEEEALQQTADGTLDMARVNIFQFNDSCPETVIPTLPFLFNSTSHMHKSLDSEPGKIILESISSQGYIGLALYDSGSRNMYAKKPIRNMTDMQGLKIRILPSPCYKQIIDVIGAKSTSLPLDEVEAELHNGTINAAENNIFSYQGFEHYRECQYYSLTQHMITPDVLVFSKKRWDKISVEDKKIIMDSAHISGIASRNLCLEAEKESRQKVESEGAIIIDDIDKSSFKGLLQDIYNSYVVTPKQRELLEKIKGIKL